MTAPLNMPMARAYAESLMDSACTIRRPSTLGEVNPETGFAENVPGEVVYSGPCRIKPASSWGRNADAGDARVTPSTFRFSIPFTATGVLVDDEVTVDECPDPAVVGRTFAVRFTPDMGGQITARRLLCEEMN